MKCKKCGAEISDKSKFCDKCGEKVVIPIEEKPLFTDSETDLKEKSSAPSRFDEKTVESNEPKVKCQKCGAIVPESYTFCDKCGEKIILPPKPQPLFKDNIADVNNHNNQIESKAKNKEKKMIKVLACALGVVSVIAIISIAVALTGNKSVQPAVVPTTQHINDYDKTSKIESFTYKEVPTEKETMAESKTETKPQSKQESKTESKVESKAESKAEHKSESKVADDKQDNNLSADKTNALRSAKGYLAVMPFSYQGLVEQLEYEQYSHNDAVYAADNCGADWNEQAKKSAKSYLITSVFSESGLIEQLEYENFTHDQAVYGVNNCGADWNEQAAKTAKSYLDVMSFSKDELIEQLEFDGFTHDQAVYGVEQSY